MNFDWAPDSTYVSVKKRAEQEWVMLGGHLLYVEYTSDRTYSLSNNAMILNKNEQVLLLSAINAAWCLWTIRADASHQDINSLETALAALHEKCKVWFDAALNVESGEYVLLPKNNIENWYLDKHEGVWLAINSIDNSLCDLALGEVQEVSRKQYAIIKHDSLYATKPCNETGNCVDTWEFFKTCVRLSLN